MKSINKILKIIYKDSDIYQMFQSMSFRGSSRLVQENDLSFFNFFDFGNERCISIVKNKFQSLFPFLYTENELDILVEYYKNMILSKKSNFDSQMENLNSSFLFQIVSERYLSIEGNELTIDFDYLLEFETIINDTDLELLLTSNSKFEGQMNSLLCFKHNNDRINQILKQGYTDTHMHLNASGYSVDINFARWVTSLKEINKKSDVIRLITRFNNNEDYEIEYQLQKKIQIIRAILISKVYGFLTEKTEDLYQGLLLDNVDFYEKTFLIAEIINRNELKSSHYQDVKNQEKSLLFKLFSLLKSNQLSDFEQFLFNVYLSFKVQFKFYFLQDNVGIGFSRFKKHENIKTLYVKNNSNEVIESVFDKYYSECGMKSVEVRIAPKSKRDYIKFVKNLNRINVEKFSSLPNAAKDTRILTLGIVIHFIKKNMSGKDSKLNYRHAEFKESLEIEKKRVMDIIETYVNDNKKETGPIKLIGLDAANEELLCRPEHVARVFREIKDKYANKIKLGLTYHVGEEFYTIASGLRAIDETIEFLNLKRGDRLGHAIVLGINYNHYFISKEKLIITNLQDFVDDMAWILSLNIINNNEYEYIYNQFRIHIQILYASTNIEIPDIYDYIDSIKLRSDKPQLYCEEIDASLEYNAICNKYKHEVNYKDENHQKSFFSSKARMIYFDYSYNHTLRENGTKPVILNTGEEYINILTKIQYYLKLKIKKIGIVIETNPSSNRKISHAREFKEVLPLNFNRKYLEENSLDIPVTINTDDSAIFQTNLELEYAYVAKSLIDSGFEEESVYKHIDYLRALSNETSFIR